MQTRNTTANSARQRSKSLPAKIPKQPIMFGSKSIPTYQQQMRMVSINSRKSQQDPKSQIDIPAVQKSLDEFEHILKNLQMTNSDISELNLLMKELKETISHFPRFLSVDMKKRDDFFKTWENILKGIFR